MIGSTLKRPKMPWTTANLSLICQMTSEDIKHQLTMDHSQNNSCVKAVGDLASAKQLD